MRLAGIEPAQPPWEGEIIPLDQSRILYVFQYSNYFKGYYSGNFMERQVRYHSSRSERNLQWMEWFFLIINDNRYIREISARIAKTFAPIAEEYKSLEGTVKGENLRFKLLHFESEKRPEPGELTGIFKKMVKDYSLYDRQNIDGLANYINDKLS